MASPYDASQPEKLLSHSGFLESLTAGLMAGSVDAEDLVQETWVSALERPPEERGGLRAWLTTVITNHLTDRRRSEGRRSARERLVAHEEGLPSTAEIVEREELRRVLVQTLLDLPEPYRSTLLLRYYEDLAPRDVAQRMDVPIETVRTRIKRGLARLRAELDRRYGNRGAWARFLVPLGRPDHVGPNAPFGAERSGAGPLGVAVRLGAGVGLLSLAVFWVLARPKPERNAVELARGGTESSVESTNETVLASVPDTSDRVPSENAIAPLELRVVRLEDRTPVEGARVEFASPPFPASAAVSDALGIALLPNLDSGRAELSIQGTPRSLAWRAEIDLEHDPTRSGGKVWLEIAVPGACQVRGRVLDSEGDPRAGAEVLAFHTLEPLLEDAEPRGMVASDLTDAGGAFTIGGLPKEFSLFARTSDSLGRDCFVAELERAEDIDGVELLLGRFAEIRGLVSSSSGEVLSGASILARALDPVGYGHGTTHRDAFYRPSLTCATRTGSDGAFALRFLDGVHAHVEVNLTGFPPREKLWSPHEQGKGRPFEIVLAEGNVQQIRVLSSEGHFIESPEVRIHCETLGVLTLKGDLQGRVELPLLPRGESVLARISAPGSGVHYCPLIRVGIDPGEVDVRLAPGQSIEGTVRDASNVPLAGSRVAGEMLVPPESPWKWVFDTYRREFARTPNALTDDRGRFRMEGLASGEYKVAAFPTDAYMPEAIADARTGDRDVELVVGTTHRAPVRIDLRVIDAEKQAPVTSFGLRIAHGEDHDIVRTFERCEGALELPWLEPGRIRLAVYADGFAPLVHEIPDCVSGRHSIDVRLVPSRSLSVRVVDAQGRAAGTGTIRCYGPDRSELLTRVGKGLWLSEIMLRPNGEARLHGLPAGPIVLEVSHPFHSERAAFELDLTHPSVDLQTLELPWEIPVNTRTITLVVRAGERSALTLSSRRLTAARNRSSDFGPATRANVRIVDSRGNGVSALAWELVDGVWERSGKQGVIIERYLPSGAQEVRYEATVHAVFATDLDHSEENTRARRAGLLLDVPTEECRLFLSIDGCEDAAWELAPQVDDGSAMETYEALVVEKR